MNKKKIFAFIFVGVIVAGLLTLGIALIVRAAVTGNPVVTIVTLFAIMAGAIMAGLGLIALLICLLLLTFTKKGKEKNEVSEVDEQTAEAPDGDIPDAVSSEVEEQAAVASDEK